jgi:hypothetical protein
VATGGPRSVRPVDPGLRHQRNESGNERQQLESDVHGCTGRIGVQERAFQALKAVLSTWVKNCLKHLGILSASWSLRRERRMSATISDAAVSADTVSSRLCYTGYYATAALQPLR